MTDAIPAVAGLMAEKRRTGKRAARINARQAHDDRSKEALERQHANKPCASGAESKTNRDFSAARDGA